MIVTSGAVQVKFLQDAVKERVTVKFPAVSDALLNMTSSALVGGPEPPAPPELPDQFVVLLLFHVPAPPTQ